MPVILDGHNLFYRIIFSNLNNIIVEDTEKKINEDYFFHLILTSLKFYYTKFKINYGNNPLIACFDSKEKSWRFNFYQENKEKFKEYNGLVYKGNREKDENIPWKKLYNLYDYFIDFLDSMGVCVLRVNELEADDLIAISVKFFEKRCSENIIITTDKDLKQLLSEKTKIYEPNKKIFFTKENINPEFLKYLIILGDKADNILPIKKRLGEKTLSKKLKEIEIEINIDKELKERYEFNRTLIDFNFIPKKYFSIVEGIIEEKIKRNIDKKKLVNFCIKHKLINILENINMFFKEEYGNNNNEKNILL